MDHDPLLEPVAQQFRLAYRQGTCDPDNCPQCDCNLNDVLREMIHSEANRLAAGVIAKVRADEAQKTEERVTERIYEAWDADLQHQRYH